MSDQPLTLQTSAKRTELPYAEEWEVYLSNSKEPFILDENQYAVLRDSLLRGIKGIIHFEQFGMNTTYYVSSYRKSRKLKPEFEPKELEDGSQRELTHEERDRARQRIEEIRQKLKVKFAQF